jgi:hypothetical protein
MVQAQVPDKPLQKICMFFDVEMGSSFHKTQALTVLVHGKGALVMQGNQRKVRYNDFRFTRHYTRWTEVESD